MIRENKKSLPEVRIIDNEIQNWSMINLENIIHPWANQTKILKNEIARIKAK